MSGGTQRASETVILGAGVIGLALGYELLRAGHRVRIVERDRPGGGASRVAGGMLATVSEADWETAELLALGIESSKRFPEFVAGVESAAGMRCGLRSEGTLWVAVDRDTLADLGHLSDTLESKGLTARPLPLETIHRLEPHLAGRVLGGLDLPCEHQVDPRLLCRALACAVERLGGRIQIGAAERVEARAGSVSAVVGRDGAGQAFRIETDSVVVAAGAWSERGLELPIAALGLRPVKGQLLRLRGPRLLTRVVRTPEVYLVPREDGELLVGATMEEMGFDVTATAGPVMDLLRCAWEVLPGIYDLELVEVSAGLRSAVDDHLPVVGETEIEGLFVASGHFRSGVLLAPATAYHLSRWILEGLPPRELEPFTPRRLARRDAVQDV
jgi:glycine oxidase